jgi:hypothetical protein
VTEMSQRRITKNKIAPQPLIQAVDPRLLRVGTIDDVRVRGRWLIHDPVSSGPLVWWRRCLDCLCSLGRRFFTLSFACEENGRMLQFRCTEE